MQGSDGSLSSVFLPPAQSVSDAVSPSHSFYHLEWDRVIGHGKTSVFFTPRKNKTKETSCSKTDERRTEQEEGETEFSRHPSSFFSVGGKGRQKDDNRKYHAGALMCEGNQRKKKPRNPTPKSTRRQAGSKTMDAFTRFVEYFLVSLSFFHLLRWMASFFQLYCKRSSSFLFFSSFFVYRCWCDGRTVVELIFSFFFFPFPFPFPFPPPLSFAFLRISIHHGGPHPTHDPTAFPPGGNIPFCSPNLMRGPC